MQRKIIAITGSYRKDGLINRSVQELLSQAGERGHTVDLIDLTERHIEFCTNCRCCTQEPGTVPGQCPLRDDMAAIVEAIEQADAYVFAAPVNFGAATAIYKRFLERLVCYAVWPWGASAPEYRKTSRAKPAVLITSSAMPGVMARFSTHAMHSLKFTARVVGARPVRTLYLGLAAETEDPVLTAKTLERLHKAASSLS